MAEQIEEMKKLAKIKAIEANKNFIKMMKATIKYIEEQKPDDRLSYASGIDSVVNAMAGSIKGWQRWCSLQQMNYMKTKMFEKYYPRMKKLALEWLKIDLEVTGERMEEMIEELEEEEKIRTNDDKKTKPKKKGDKPSSSIYVA